MRERSHQAVGFLCGTDTESRQKRRQQALDCFAFAIGMTIGLTVAFLLYVLDRLTDGMSPDRWEQSTQWWHHPISQGAGIVGFWGAKKVIDRCQDPQRLHRQERIRERARIEAIDEEEGRGLSINDTATYNAVAGTSSSSQNFIP
jgi:hypothetical protein